MQHLISFLSSLNMNKDFPHRCWRKSAWMWRDWWLPDVWWWPGSCKQSGSHPPWNQSLSWHRPQLWSRHYRWWTTGGDRDARSRWIIAETMQHITFCTFIHLSEVEQRHKCRCCYGAFSIFALLPSVLTHTEYQVHQLIKLQSAAELWRLAISSCVAG